MVHAGKELRAGRPERGQMLYHSNRFQGSTFWKDEHAIVIKISNMYFVAMYLKFCLDLDEKVGVICDVLDKIYEDCSDTLILLGGDLNIKSSVNQGAELEALEEILEEYNLSIKSDTKIPTCFNNYRGESTCDYTASSPNFSPITKIEKIKMNSRSNHSPLRITFKLPRYVLEPELRIEIELTRKINSESATGGLKTLESSLGQ